MIGSTIVPLDCVDSTNNYAARELLTKSLNEGTVILASCQQAGRGEGNSTWESDAGLNLTFSIVLYPSQIKVVNHFDLSKAISLGVADFLNLYVSGVTVKWPNDIYVGNKKISGILIETAISGGKFTRAIVGIGLNVNQVKFLSDAPNPVSLKNLTGQTYELSEVLAGLCRNLNDRYLQLIDGQIAAIHADYVSRLYRLGVWSQYEAGDEILEAILTGVGPDGQLLLTTRKGQERQFMFKEVKFR